MWVSWTWIGLCVMWNLSGLGADVWRTRSIVTAFGLLCSTVIVVIGLLVGMTWLLMCMTMLLGSSFVCVVGSFLSGVTMASLLVTRKILMLRLVHRLKAWVLNLGRLSCLRQVSRGLSVRSSLCIVLFTRCCRLIGLMQVLLSAC